MTKPSQKQGIRLNVYDMVRLTQVKVSLDGFQIYSFKKIDPYFPQARLRVNYVYYSPSFLDLQLVT